MTTGDRFLALIEASPGLTQVQLAQGLFGRDADSRSLIDETDFLLKFGLVERRGVGGRGDPYQYCGIKP